MRMKAMAVLALAAGAFAQGPPAERGGRGHMGFEPSGNGAAIAETGAGIPRAGVRNAPFSADVVTESSLTLADGNRIRQTVNFKMYRDSEGRTRREQAVNLNGLAPSANVQQMVFINDPAGGVAYSLNVKERTGTKTLRGAGGRGFQRMGQPAPGREPGLRSGPEGRGPRFNRMMPKVETLGRQTIEGVQAEGRRMTLTIPAGQAGNEQPIHIVTETWYSPELQAAVLTRHTDPRTGETVTRLTNIARTEPPHSLFEAPADFRLVETTFGMPRPAGQAKQ